MLKAGLDRTSLKHLIIFFISPSYQDKVQWKRRINIKRKTNQKNPNKWAQEEVWNKRWQARLSDSAPYFGVLKQFCVKELVPCSFPQFPIQNVKYNSKMMWGFVQIQGNFWGNCANLIGNLARIASVLSHSEYLWTLAIWKVSLWCLRSVNTLTSSLQLLGMQLKRGLPTGNTICLWTVYKQI